MTCTAYKSPEDAAHNERLVSRALVIRDEMVAAWNRDTWDAELAYPGCDALAITLAKVSIFYCELMEPDIGWKESGFGYDPTSEITLTPYLKVGLALAV